MKELFVFLTLIILIVGCSPIENNLTSPANNTNQPPLEEEYDNLTKEEDVDIKSEGKAGEVLTAGVTAYSLDNILLSEDDESKYTTLIFSLTVKNLGSSSVSYNSCNSALIVNSRQYDVRGLFNCERKNVFPGAIDSFLVSFGVTDNWVGGSKWESFPEEFDLVFDDGYGIVTYHINKTDVGLLGSSE